MAIPITEAGGGVAVGQNTRNEGAGAASLPQRGRLIGWEVCEREIQNYLPSPNHRNNVSEAAHSIGMQNYSSSLDNVVERHFRSDVAQELIRKGVPESEVREGIVNGCRRYPRDAFMPACLIREVNQVSILDIYELLGMRRIGL